MGNILSFLTQFYGLDWLSMVFGLWGFYLITHNKNWGFLLQGIASVLGISVAILAGQVGNVVYNVVFTVIALQGYSNWLRIRQIRH